MCKETVANWQNSLCPNTETIGVKLKPVLKNENAVQCPAKLSICSLLETDGELTQGALKMLVLKLGIEMKDYCLFTVDN